MWSTVIVFSHIFTIIIVIIIIILMRDWSDAVTALTVTLYEHIPVGHSVVVGHDRW